MRKRVVIHAGAPKTGTTSLQHSLLRRRQELSDLGILYPAISATRRDVDPDPEYTAEEQGDAFCFFPSSSASLFWRGRKTALPRQYQGERLPEIEREWDEVLHRFRNDHHHTMILSAETLFFQHEVHGLAVLDEALSGMDRELAVCLRHPEELLHSLYCQSVKSLIQATVPARRHPALPAYLLGGYAGLVAELTQALGTPRAHLFWMGDQWQGGRSILGGFLSLVGLDVALEQDFRSNPTPDEETILLLRLLNRRGFPYDVTCSLKRAQRAASSGSSARRSSFFPEPVQARIAQRFARDIEILSRRHGLAAERAPVRPILPYRDGLDDAEVVALIDRLMQDSEAESSPMILRMRNRLARELGMGIGAGE